ncbi:MAG: UvrB/UvrC motif-containing protein [Gemmatimonadetes bacterium]|nr:UvrB/UvrC motif-containing protein [Gemmatimonadota bacterium]
MRARAENRPGVYRMLGPDDVVLYVGRSVRVRTRLLSYFRATRGEKADEIVRNTHRIEWEYVPSEFAALLHELRSIKHWRPPYNVVHRRDRSYAFIRLTRDSAPRLQAVPAMTGDGAAWFGPFFGPERLREAVREIADVLELRDCARNTPMRFADQLDLFGALDRTPLCMRGDLGRCLAPCAGRCTRAAYAAQVEIAVRFLEGEADGPLAILRSRMEAASERLQFEYAATLRDRLDRLESIRDELVALRSTIDALTFVYPVAGHAGDDRAYIIRRGAVLADAPVPAGRAERQALLERAERLCTGRQPQPFGIDPAEATEILTVARWFRLRPEERRRTFRWDEN